MFSCELLIIFGRLVHYKIQHMNNALEWKKSVLCNSQWKVSKQMSVDINNGGTLVLIDCTFLNKEDVLTSKQVSFEWKQNSLFNMI